FIFHLAESRLQCFLPEIEYFREPTLHHQVMGDSSNEREGQDVIHRVDYLDPAFDITEVVLVMPEFERTEPLLINKVFSFFHMCDLCNPLDGEFWERFDIVLDDHTSIHAWRRSEEHTSELQSRFDLVCRLLLEKKNSGSTNDKLQRKAPIPSRRSRKHGVHTP